MYSDKKLDYFYTYFINYYLNNKILTNIKYIH